MIARMYYVMCDQCGETSGLRDTSKQARRLAQVKKWSRIKGSQSWGKDFCPQCAEARSRATQKLVERAHQ